MVPRGKSSGKWVPHTQIAPQTLSTITFRDFIMAEKGFASITEWIKDIKASQKQRVTFHIDYGYNGVEISFGKHTFACTIQWKKGLPMDDLFSDLYYKTLDNNPIPDYTVCLFFFSTHPYHFIHRCYALSH